MGFSDILGNDGLKARLSPALREQKFSHSYLLCGAPGSGKHLLASLLCQAMECQHGENVPCGVCPQCRKVQNGTHPDIITVDEPEKKGISVSAARWAAGDLYIRPNEGKRKIYLFPRAQDLNPAAQNALLKVMEEPPAYGVFLLLADRAESLLPTVRSRCVELHMAPVEQRLAIPWLRARFPSAAPDAPEQAWRQSGGYLGQAAALLESGEQTDPRALALADAFADGDRLAMAELLCKLEKVKREQLIPVLRQFQELLAGAMTAGAGAPSVSPTVQRLAAAKTASRLLQAYRDLQEFLLAADGNVGVGHICGALAVRLR